MLIIAGHVHVDAEQRDEYVGSFRDLVEHSMAARGCLDVSISSDPLDHAGQRPRALGVMGRRRRMARVANPPNVGIEMTSNHVKMYTATDERSPFEPEAEPPTD